MSDVVAIVTPQLNVNDEEVRLVRWLVERGAKVASGDPVCVVETSKAASEVIVDADGVVVPTATIDEMVKVGAALGYLGPTLEAIDCVLASLPSAAIDTAELGLRATPRAAALARKHGVDLARVATAGITGTIKEADVERFMASTGAPARASDAVTIDESVPHALLNRLAPAERLSRHELAMIQGLQHAASTVIRTTLDYDLSLDRIGPRIVEARRGGTMLSLQHVAIAGAGRALSAFPRLMAFRQGVQVHRYREVDVAFVVRSLDGRLFTPVVRGAGALSPAEVARACGAATMRVNRGQIAPDELQGACFTISHIAVSGVSRFEALPNQYQSAILAMASERPSGNGSAVTFTLSYDHALCDGSYAASFMKTLASAMETVVG